MTIATPQVRSLIILLAAGVLFAAPYIAFAELDGTPPAAPAITVNGAPLPATAPVGATLVATTTSLWETVLLFDEDISNLPTVTDGTPNFGFTNGTAQAVDDCADSDLKTFCFTYSPPLGFEATSFWFFRVADAADLSGEVMAPATYRFLIDTAGPVLVFTSVTGGPLPTISGDSSFTSTIVDLTIAGGDVNRIYRVTADSALWSLTLLPGDELPGGEYTVTAVGTDQHGNVGAPIVANFSVVPPPDTAAPMLAEVTPVGTSPDSTAVYTFSSTEAATLTYGGSCGSDTTTAAAGNNTIELLPLSPGTYSGCTITATDAAGNASLALVMSTFTIQPPPVVGPTDKRSCFNDGWRAFTNPAFKNQGQCVSHVNSL